MSELSDSEKAEIVAALMYYTQKGMSWANCWSFANEMITPSADGPYKLQPGHLAGNDKPIVLSNCADLERHIMQDGRAVKKPKTGCPAGMHEIAAYVSKNKDFHFYRKDKDLVIRIPARASAVTIAKKYGVDVSKVVMVPKVRVALLRDANLWSHKPGTTAVASVDSCGNPISDPDKACRGSADLVYKLKCSRFCVKNPSFGAVSIAPANATPKNMMKARHMSALAHRFSTTVNAP